MKKITLLMMAFFTAIIVNAQADCSSAQVVTVGADASTTVNASQISGTAPLSSTCNPNYYDVADITAANWYSYTNNSGQDLLVTVNSPVPTSQTSYYASFSLFSGACTSLTCEGGDIITQNQQSQLQRA